MADRSGSGLLGRTAGALFRAAGARRAERRGEAVEETVARAVETPRDVLEDVRQGLREVAPHAARFLLAASAVIVLAATAWVVFAVALVAVGTRVFGDPGGVVAAFLILALAALAGFAWARASLRLAAARGGEAGQEVREDLERVAEPFQEATFPRRYGDASYHHPPGGAG